MPYAPVDMSAFRVGAGSSMSRSYRRPSMPTTSTLLENADIPPSKRPSPPKPIHPTPNTDRRPATGEVQSAIFRE
ncbi:hypothetical protein GCM10009733_004440 [Nonomuraea maheshkhaliensis]|uniref:Uncharacterized protein n=1 Tax=Nonomuraea maheshkhaliensis TaxID=419590 RepID=A0ABN2ELY6_9ACTN